MTTNNQLDSVNPERLKITLVRSASGRLPKHKATLSSIGLRRIGQSVSRFSNKATLGMINKISYLVTVEKE